MKIGIDIDDTITNSSKVIKKHLKRYPDKELRNNIIGIIRGTYVTEESSEFFKKYNPIMQREIRVKRFCKKYLEKLHKKGYEIIIITARNNVYYDDAYKTCEDYLKSHNVYYDKLYVNAPYKLEICKQEGIDIMIDDAVDTIDECTKNNIHSILMHSELNKGKETLGIRKKSWREIYRHITKLKKTK